MAEFDFNQLRKEIKNAAQKAYSSVRKSHPQEKICAYALYSDPGAITICPAVNTRKHLTAMQKADPLDKDTYKWSTAEWVFEYEGSEFSLKYHQCYVMSR